MDFEPLATDLYRPWECLDHLQFASINIQHEHQYTYINSLDQNWMNFNLSICICMSTVILHQESLLFREIYLMRWYVRLTVLRIINLSTDLDPISKSWFDWTADTSFSFIFQTESKVEVIESHQGDHLPQKKGGFRNALYRPKTFLFF